MLWEIYDRNWATAAEIFSLLMNDVIQLAAPLAQVSPRAGAVAGTGGWCAVGRRDGLWWAGRLS